MTEENTVAPTAIDPDAPTEISPDVPTEIDPDVPAKIDLDTPTKISPVEPLQADTVLEEKSIQEEAAPSREHHQQQQQDGCHLFVLMHGLHGSWKDFVFFQETLYDKIDEMSLENEPIKVLNCKSNSEKFRQTEDGINVGGERILQELDNYMHQEGEGVRFLKMTIIGHSLGGLYARYVAGRLYMIQKAQKSHESELDEGKNDNPNVNPAVPTARASPMVPSESETRFDFDISEMEFANFVAIAAPNLGSLQLTKGWGGSVVRYFSTKLLGDTGKQLMLADVTDPDPNLSPSSDGQGDVSDNQPNSQIPLLVGISDGEYLEAIENFQKKILVANIRGDLSVPYSTACIATRNPYKNFKSDEIKKLCPENSIILNPEHQLGQSEGPQDDSQLFNVDAANATHLRGMYERLNRIEWDRIQCWGRLLFAHTDVVVKRERVNGVGAEIVRTVIDKLSIL